MHIVNTTGAPLHDCRATVVSFPRVRGDPPRYGEELRWRRHDGLRHVHIAAHGHEWLVLCGRYERTAVDTLSIPVGTA